MRWLTEINCVSLRLAVTFISANNSARTQTKARKHPFIRYKFHTWKPMRMHNMVVFTFCGAAFNSVQFIFHIPFGCCFFRCSPHICSLAAGFFVSFIHPEHGKSGIRITLVRHADSFHNFSGRAALWLDQQINWKASLEFLHRSFNRTKWQKAARSMAVRYAVDVEILITLARQKSATKCRPIKCDKLLVMAATKHWLHYNYILRCNAAAKRLEWMQKEVCEFCRKSTIPNELPMMRNQCDLTHQSIEIAQIIEYISLDNWIRLIRGGPAGWAPINTESAV